MKNAWLRTGLELFLVTLLVPQVFILCYFFPLFFHGGHLAGLFRSLVVYAITISWVSAPFLISVTLLFRVLITTRVRGYVTFLFCMALGYLWLFAWNQLVYEMFTYGRAAIPVFLCSLGTVGYALARAVYLDGLPSAQVKNTAVDLPK